MVYSVHLSARKHRMEQTRGRSQRGGRQVLAAETQHLRLAVIYALLTVGGWGTSRASSTPVPGQPWLSSLQPAGSLPPWPLAPGLHPQA